MRLLALLLWTLLAGSMCAGAAPEPSRPLVMVHVMPWFEAPPTHPTWGWHWTMGKTQPASGSLATHDRPLIGAYLDFFKDGFHPWQHNNLDLLEQFRGEFEPASSAVA